MDCQPKFHSLSMTIGGILPDVHIIWMKGTINTWVHQLREKWLMSWKFINYRRIIYGKSKCMHCGLTVKPFREYYHDFLELHETVKIDFKTEYIKIVPENFVILCPNCHKLEHEKIKNENIE